MATVDWAEVHRSTKPANKPVAERAIRELYRLRGLKRPAVIWVASPAEGVEICRDPKTPPGHHERAPSLDEQLPALLLPPRFRGPCGPLLDPTRPSGRPARSGLSTVRRDVAHDPRWRAEGTRWLLQRALGAHLVPDGNFDRPWTSRVVLRPRASRRCSSASSTACLLPPATSASNVAGRLCPRGPGYLRTCRSWSATSTSRGPRALGGHGLAWQSSLSDPGWRRSTTGAAFTQLMGRRSDIATDSRHGPSLVYLSRLGSSPTPSPSRSMTSRQSRTRRSVDR